MPDSMCRVTRYGKRRSWYEAAPRSSGPMRTRTHCRQQFESSPEFRWDRASTWSSGVFGCVLAPVLVQIGFFTFLENSLAGEALDRALTVLLTWCLVVGLALAGLGQIMQALEHDQLGGLNRGVRSVGTLIGVAGWSSGLLAGVFFPLVENRVTDPEGFWDDPTNYVFPIAWIAPLILWAIIAVVRPFLLWSSACKDYQERWRMPQHWSYLIVHRVGKATTEPARCQNRSSKP